jgi:ATP-dependent 26S proteasome regulatory subunit
MSHEDPGNVSFGEVGGLSEQIRELREVKKTFSKIENIQIVCYRSWNYL